jgi:hypothetical protein
MAKYLREAGSQFPNAIYSPTGFLDATDEIMGLINQIKDLQLEKDTKKIQELINKNSQLKKYIFGAKDINKIDEEIINLERYAKNVQQQIFYQTENPIAHSSNQDVWIA